MKNPVNSVNLIFAEFRVILFSPQESYGTSHPRVKPLAWFPSRLLIDLMPKLTVLRTIMRESVFQIAGAKRHASKFQGRSVCQHGLQGHTMIPTPGPRASGLQEVQA